MDALKDWYRSYNAICNAHRVEELGAFVAGTHLGPCRDGG